MKAVRAILAAALLAMLVAFGASLFRLAAVQVGGVVCLGFNSGACWAIAGDAFDAAWLIQRLDFQWVNVLGWWSVGRGHVVCPMWLPILLTAGLLLIVHRHCRRRPGPGCCRVCGYDLRGTPERCPECGAVPENAGELT